MYTKSRFSVSTCGPRLTFCHRLTACQRTFVSGPGPRPPAPPGPA